MTDQEKKIKRYIRAVERRLNMPRDVRERVMGDFTSTVSARLEQGGSAEEIIASLGRPKEAAAQLNEQMKEFTYRKSPWRFAFLAAAAASGVYLLGKAAQMALVYHLTGSEAASMGVIGGADGPTAIFVTTSVEPLSVEAGLLLAAVLLVAGVLGYRRFCRCRKK